MTADTDIDEILCMRIRGPADRYPIVTYEGAVYSQLEERHVGLTVLAREISPRELMTPAHAAVWERYRRERPVPDENGLLRAGAREPLRLFLHVMSDNSECLVAARALEIRREPSGRRRYWELGYRFADPVPGAAR